MPSKPEPSRPTQENPEWTTERVARGKRFSDLPVDMQAALSSGKPASSFVVPKVPVTLSLSPDVAARLQAGPGDWQTRLEEHLKDWLENEKSTAA